GRAVVFCSLFPPERRGRLQQLAVPAFDDPGTAVRSVAALAFFAAQRQAAVTPAAAAPAALPAADAPAWPADGTATEAAALAALAAHGIPVVPAETAATVDAAANAAARIGYPVVLKIVSPDIAHKSDVGGVR